MLIALMAEEERYNNRQIERMLEEQTRNITGHIDDKTRPILDQVLKTNGRVTANEADIVAYKIWRGWMTGGMAVIMIILPLVVSFMVWLGLSVMRFDTRMTQLSEIINE